MPRSPTTHPSIKGKTYLTPPSGHNSGHASRDKWLALYFPSLALEIFQSQGLHQPQAATQMPKQVQVVIEEQKRVSHMNEAADAAGILPGCTLATAHSISPELIYFQRDANREQACLMDLAQALYRYSSMVSLESPDCIVLEIKGSLKLWGNAQTISQDALALCADMGYHGVARHAATPQAAIALARAQTHSLFNVPLHVLELLNQGFSQRNLERLSNMGIYTLGQLIQLPHAGLGKRFGQCLTRYLGRLQGQLPDPRQGIRPAEHFSRQQHLLKPIRNKEVLLRGPMPYLTKQLEHWLIAHQQGCIALNWRFAPFKGEATRLVIRLGQGKQRHQDILKLSALKLENIELPSEVLTVGLDMTVSQPWLGNNQDLFGSTASATLAISELVDELRARLGQRACYSIRTQPQHSPEQAWQGVTGLSAKPANEPATDPAATDQRSAGLLQGRRPLWLFRQPQAIAREQLILLQGPERLADPMTETGVNAASAEHRDYYIARHAHGALCWVYTHQAAAPADNNSRWFLHGYFG
jgi:protein ImuB